MYKKSNAELFCLNSTVARQHIKKRILKEQLISYVCSDCGQLPFWNNKPLVLQLEHKNGINNDYRLENLTFLCPNCHSQTDTYAGKGSTGFRCSDPKPSFKEMKRERDKQLLEILKTDASIGFNTWGWKKRLADKIGISSQKVDKWLQRVDANFMVPSPRGKAAVLHTSIASVRF